MKVAVFKALTLQKKNEVAISTNNFDFESIHNNLKIHREMNLLIMSLIQNQHLESQINTNIKLSVDSGLCFCRAGHAEKNFRAGRLIMSYGMSQSLHHGAPAIHVDALRTRAGNQGESKFHQPIWKTGSITERSLKNMNILLTFLLKFKNRFLRDSRGHSHRWPVTGPPPRFRPVLWLPTPLHNTVLLVARGTHLVGDWPGLET